jgi:hypothetical protein
MIVTCFVTLYLLYIQRDVTVIVKGCNLEGNDSGKHKGKGKFVPVL